MKEGHAYGVVLSFNYKVHSEKRKLSVDNVYWIQVLLSFAPQFVSVLTSFRLLGSTISQQRDPSDLNSRKKVHRGEDILVASADGDMG